MVENVSSTTTTPPPTPPNSCPPGFKFQPTTMSLEGNGVGPTTNSTTSLPSDGLLQVNLAMGGPSNQDASTILKVSTAAASATDRHSVANFCGQPNSSTSNSANSSERVNGDLSGSSSSNSNNSNNFHGNPSLGVDVSSLSLKKLYNSSESTPKSPSVGSPSKGILESFLTRSVIQQSIGTSVESQPSAAMDEGSPPAKHRHHHHHHHNHHHHNHHGASTTPGDVVVDTRKVEPLKINIHREPIKTVIKVPPATTPTKITSKPINKEGEAPPSIPKLHIKNMSESSFVISDDDEPEVVPAQTAAETSSSQPYVVPKLTIVRNPLPAQPAVTSTSAASNHFIVASSDGAEEGGIPKLTIKANHQNSNHQEVNEPPQPTVPKLCLKNLPQLQPLHKSEVGVITTHHKDVRLTIKPIVEPPLPKILIKTKPASSNCVAHVEVVPDQAASSSSSVEQPPPATIPKLTIKPIPKPELPPMPHLTKVTIKPIVRPTSKDHDSGGGASGNVEPLNTSGESSVKPPPPVMPILHKLNIKPIVDPAQPQQKETVPKLSIKLSDLASSKKQPPTSAASSTTADPDSSKETSPSSSSLLSASANRLSLSNSSLNSTSISSSGEDDAEAVPRPVVIPKLTIKMVIADDKNPDETITETVVTPKVTLKPIPKPSVQQPLEIVTTTRSVSPAQESGQDSPRIILKINKTVQESRSGNTRENITSELVTIPSQPPVVEKMAVAVEKAVVEKESVVEPKVVEQPTEDVPVRVPTPPMPKEIPTAPTPEILEEQPEPVAPTPPPEVVDAVSAKPDSPVSEVAQPKIPLTQAKAMEPVTSPTSTLPNILRHASLKNRLAEPNETPNNKRPAEVITDLTMDSDEDVTTEAVAPKRAKRMETEPTPVTIKLIPKPQTAATPAPAEPDERSMRTRRFKATALTPVVKNTPKTGKQAPKPDDPKPGIVTRTKRNLKGDATPGGSTTTTRSVNLKKSENNNKATEPTPKRARGATGDVDVEQELLKQVTLAYGLTQHVNNGTATPPTFKDFENMIDASAQLEQTPAKKAGRGRPRKIIKAHIIAIEDDRDTTSSPMPTMEAGDPKVSGRGKAKCDTPNSVIEILDDDEDEEVNALETVAKAVGSSAIEVDPLAGTTPPPMSFAAKEDAATGCRTNATTTPGRGRGGPRSRGGRPPKPKIVEVMKNGKMVQIALERKDEDDSPSFSLWNRYGKKGRGRGRGGPGRGHTAGGPSRGGSAGRGGAISFGASRSRWGQTALLLQQQQLGLSPEKIAPDSPFTSPCSVSKDFLKRKPFLHDLSSPPFFEEDTRMSSSDVFQTPTRITYDSMNYEESQSSQSGFSGTTTESSRKRGKMEVNNKDGKTEFTIDMLAEYEWPPPNDDRKSDVFMIQEQIAEYLGVKSFKRKYPDLVRRPVDMEERNYIMERGLASEKMCDLGLTALYASEILDIISNDYPEKYEEYKRYHREKFFRELSNRQRWKQMYEPVDRSQMQKDKAVESAAAWNAEFNKDRTENRRACMDLQTQIVQLPKTAKTSTEPQPSTSAMGNYPVALVPGQFADYYKEYSPVELACYPINTALLDTKKLSGYLSAAKIHEEVVSSDDDDEDSISSGSSSDSDTTSDSSSDDEVADNNCAVCRLPQNRNPNDKPERFIQCTTCQQKGHPSCIGMSTRMLDRVREYKWQCASCKTCVKCRNRTHTDKMLFCDQCDRGYHIYCIGLRNVPEGRWHCSVCSICTRCGSRSAEGHPNPSLTLQQKQNLLIMAHWTHQYRTNTASKIKEHCQTLCILCAKQQNL